MDYRLYTVYIIYIYYIYYIIYIYIYIYNDNNKYEESFYSNILLY